jgi:hypothetical protein
MKAKNLDDSQGMQVQEWSAVENTLDTGLVPGPDTGGPNRFTTWLTTINPDGSPHVVPIGAVWVDGTFWFQTGDTTRKAKNIAGDPRCTMSVSVDKVDLVLEGTASKVSDPAAVSRIVAEWVKGGWPCEVDSSGIGVTAPFNAPAVGPAPWFVYRITPRAALSVSTAQPGGTTRFKF